ncbi:MAG: hypothetical protein RLZZ490_2122 [Cyanobacteriota bacterium]|jgi:hypothetical protein
MASNKGMWVYSPPKKAKPKVPELLKKSVQEKADELIENTLKPIYIKAPPTDPRFNYLADIYSKWYRNYFHFCTTYNCPGENAISPSFEAKFARMEYMGNDKFNLSYMRHTNQWWELYQDLSLEDCFKLIVEQPHFHP